MEGDRDEVLGAGVVEDTHQQRTHEHAFWFSACGCSFTFALCLAPPNPCHFSDAIVLRYLPQKEKIAWMYLVELLKMQEKKVQKTINIRDSLVVTHPTQG